MQIGIHYAKFDSPGGTAAIAPTLVATAKAADEGGAALITVMDHFFQLIPFGGPSKPMLEAYTTLGYIAALTKRIDVGVLVTGVTYRYPALLAKIVTTLDVLSGGRAVLGLGAAWYEQEHVGLGVPFPPLKERFERLEETLQICRQMFSDDNGPFRGKHYTLGETINIPATMRQPRVPVMIGGGGERKTLKLVARYGDLCNLFGEGVDVVKHKLDVLRQHCDDEKRDYATITKTLLSRVPPLRETDEFLRQMEQYAALGISMVMMVPDSNDPVRWTTDVLDKILPRIQGL